MFAVNSEGDDVQESWLARGLRRRLPKSVITSGATDGISWVEIDGERFKENDDITLALYEGLPPGVKISDATDAQMLDAYVAVVQEMLAQRKSPKEPKAVVNERWPGYRSGAAPPGAHGYLVRRNRTWGPWHLKVTWDGLEEPIDLGPVPDAVRSNINWTDLLDWPSIANEHLPEEAI